MEENEKKVCVILGPTATGKSDLSIWLANKIKGEIVSADSMQIYKEMDIATAKVSKEIRKKVPHHMLDFLEIDKNFSVAEYVEMSKKIIDEILKKNKKPILVGGTGLYIDSLLNGAQFNKNSTDENLKQQLKEELNTKGKEYMFFKLKELDPNYAEKVHMNNTKRILRAIEKNNLTKKTIKENNNFKQTFNSLKIGLNFKNRENLYEKINMRIDKMLEKGLLKEAKQILFKKCSKTAKQAIGYKELEPYFLKQTSLEEAILKLKQNSRKYAKRQITWFKKDKEINWFFLDEEEKSSIKEKILELLKNFYN